jgi:hypothetical protein
MQKGTKAKMNDHEYSKELISIDGDLYNTIDNESSLSFLYKNSGIIADHERVLLKIIQSLGFSEEIHSLIYDKLCSLFPPKQGIGVIQVISIPKYIIENEATNPIYRAHPFGRYCECSPNSSVEILRTVQENYRPFIVEQHKESRQVLQWRILSNFGDFPGVRVHTLTPFAESKSFKEPLKLLIKEILIYKDLWNINALSEKDVDDIRARIIRLQLNQVHFSLEIVNLIGLQLGKDLSSFFVNLK